jgi:hypothetical protein
MNVQLVSFIEYKVTKKIDIKYLKNSYGVDNSKNHLGACQRILIIFLPQKVYKIINKLIH